jgi:formate dehydrogenase maturation protein FdhE
VPSVDEVAAPALDIWAQEQGYEKIDLNLAGIRARVEQQKVSPHR